MSEELLKIPYLFAIGQGILIAVSLLIQKSVSRKANYILAIFISAMILPLWQGFIQLGPAELLPLSIPHLFTFLPWLYGPLLYLYVALKCEPNSVSNNRIVLQLVYLIYPALFVTFFPFWSSLVGTENLISITWALIFTQMLVHIVLSINILRRYQTVLAENYSSTEKRDLQWLTNLVIGFCIIFALDMSIFYLKNFFDIDNGWYFHTFVFAESLYIFTIGLFSLRYRSAPSEQLVTPEIKYEKSSLNAQVASKLADSIQSLMAEEKLFLENDLTLQNLADRLNVTTHHLSQVINEHLNVSFYELINQRRIQHSKVLLKNGQTRFTILDIAHEVGFNNKTSFNNAFKKYTGMTPSQYRQSQAA
ncbi:helix-turn-helix domain-containing protein [Pleionea sediminis]|uniref:helix-turn-helix domain-containing protein n=1 Tax=Pleionea sediminis TaxID=2569479 RepID=UPI001185CAC2|nr:helix-turn-helix transcriptional regulator [Pleionea sediminis]